MKISYKVLKNYIPDLEAPESVAQKLVMHTAEVEEIIYEWTNLESVFIGEVQTCEKHPESDKLKCTTVNVCGKTYPIVCGAPNVKAGIKVPVALVWAELAPDFTISKTKIRWEVSEWMICSEDELWLTQVRQEWILELPIDSPLNLCMRDYLEKNDAILEIDNKAINHRPDLFSHIWIIREIYAINGKKFDFEYETYDISEFQDLWIKNEIPKIVSRYMWVKVENVSNIETPEYIKQVLSSAWVASKWLLVDITNYSLYLYGQPTHCFDADKIDGTIVVRMAQNGEKFIALDDVEYELSAQDIVIADNSKILALGGIIWAKSSSVIDETKNIVIESAHFDQAVVRKTGKRLGIRTDALNLFEKDLVNGMQDKAMALIINELEKNLKNIQIVSASDIYANTQKKVLIDFDRDFYNKLIWKNYEQEEIIKILQNLGITLIENESKLEIPFWRKDLHYKADIAEEIARISWYDAIESTISNINSGAVSQENMYMIKNDARNFLTNLSYFDMYNYSFVNERLMKMCLWNTDGLIQMKNYLSEDMTHLRWSLIPNLLLSIQKNIKERSCIKLFEIGKVFTKSEKETSEHYYLSGVALSDWENAYYEIQKTIRKLFCHLQIDRYFFETATIISSFAHSGRTAEIRMRWQVVWYVWEINPRVRKNFDIDKRVWFFEICLDSLQEAVYRVIKAREISSFQENNFDLNFVIDKENESKKIKNIIEKTDTKLIQKVELIDIYENEDTLPGKRSITFRVFIQSMAWTIDDTMKWELRAKIVVSVWKVGWELR